MLSLQFISIGSIDQKGSGNYDSGNGRNVLWYPVKDLLIINTL